MAEKKVTGPASYFPSIEKSTGINNGNYKLHIGKYKRAVAHLKEKFEMGHGHANAIVAVFRQKNGL